MAKSLGMYDQDMDGTLVLEMGEDPTNGALVMRAQTLWQLGYLDKALQDTATTKAPVPRT